MPSVILEPESIPITVNNIFCIGRNFAKHISELGNSGGETPVVFLKPTSALAREGTAIRLPHFSQNVHHEVEIVILIGKDGSGIPREQALDHVLGYGIGLDLTARDTQDELKKKGLPWMISKGFDTSACVSSFLKASEIPDTAGMSFSLDVNGVTRQSGNSGMMLFPLPDLVAYLSSVATLHFGDIIFTGTPEGVAQIHSGDVLTLNLMDRLHARFTVS